jgi:hypothetical protein
MGPLCFIQSVNNEGETSPLLYQTTVCYDTLETGGRPKDREDLWGATKREKKVFWQMQFVFLSRWALSLAGRLLCPALSLSHVHRNTDENTARLEPMVSSYVIYILHPSLMFDAAYTIYVLGQFDL